MTQHTVETPSASDIPENVMFLAQSGTQNDFYQTIIDLKTNEMVVLRYSRTMLRKVYRTGIELNPEDYKDSVVEGTDAHFGNQTERSNSRDLEED